MKTTTATSRADRASRGHHVVVAPDAPASLERIVHSLLASDEPFRDLEPLASPGLNSRVAKLALETAAGTRSFAVKLYAWSPLTSLRTFARATRARTEFETLEVLASFAPAPVRAAAWGERRALGFASRSVLVTEFLPDAVSLKSWRLAFARGERPAEERERLVAALPELVRFMRCLHDSGFFARNAFQKNVLWRPSAPAAEAFSLVDLPFARLGRGPLSLRRRIYDLACLDKDASMVLSSSERLRLYLAYVGRGESESGDRSVLRRIARERSRRAHATFFSGIERGLKKHLKRTRVGKLLTGRDPEQRSRNER
jgi:hypothetical protein